MLLKRVLPKHYLCWIFAFLGRACSVGLMESSKHIGSGNDSWSETCVRWLLLAICSFCWDSWKNYKELKPKKFIKVTKTISKILSQKVLSLSEYFFLFLCVALAFLNLMLFKCCLLFLLSEPPYLSYIWIFMV